MIGLQSEPSADANEAANGGAVVAGRFIIGYEQRLAQAANRDDAPGRPRLRSVKTSATVPVKLKLFLSLNDMLITWLKLEFCAMFLV
jgi:hypothetical protein